MLQSANAIAARAVARGLVVTDDVAAALGRANFMAYLDTYEPLAALTVDETQLDAVVERLLARLPPDRRLD